VPPYFHLLAGPNGAGKSTLYKALLAQGVIDAACEFVNADEYERDHLQHMPDAQSRSEAARAWADARRATLLTQGASFASETVFSHESKLQLIAQAQQMGFVVALYVVALDEPQRLLARVTQRVREGGHTVPPDKILSRYPRTLANLAQAVLLADAAYLYDACEVEDGGHQLAAICAGGRVVQRFGHAPPWVQTVLSSR
jgi:predicted ABC-type ATPase